MRYLILAALLVGLLVQTFRVDALGERDRKRSRRLLDCLALVTLQENEVQGIMTVQQWSDMCSLGVVRDLGINCEPWEESE